MNTKIVIFITDFNMTTYHTFLMYPYNATAVMLGRQLLSNGHDLSLFCPSDLHKRQALTTPYELSVIARGFSRSSRLVEDLDTLDTADFIIFPTLDVDHAEKREIFAMMMKDLFQ